MKIPSSTVKYAATLYVSAVLIVAIIFFSTSLFGEQKVVAPLCEFTKIPVNETAKREVTLQNPTSRPIQFIGAMVPCTLYGCTTAEGLPITIPAGQSGSISVLFNATGEGHFSTEIELYTDNPEQTTVHLPVRGDVIKTNE